MDDQDHSPLENDELSEYDIYSKTPPRTKILRKNRDRKVRERQTSSPIVSSKTKSSLTRRHTTGTMHEDTYQPKSEHQDEDGPKRLNKRQMKLLRGSERDLKLDIAIAQAANSDHQLHDDLPEELEYPKTPSYQIESNKRFMSLMGRTVPCKKQFCPKGRAKDEEQENRSCERNEEEPPLNGECPARRMSREESLWQNELKDLIWLELQAYHADRTPVEEDAYLCMARECVEPLLNDIKNYKFQRPSRRYLTQNSDSGLEEDCPGCVSIYCHPCLEAQNEALGEIERLLKRLEEAERLFPSSKAFAELYPLYRSPEIVGRVRAMCQWYNMTKIQRLKLNILGRLVVLLDSKRSDWPCSSAGDDNGSGSPSDSNNSTNSTFSLISNQDCSNTNDLYQPVSPICDLLAPKSGSNKVSPYRRYIENVLKTRALDKSLNFLSNLHSHVLRKTQITLEYPDDAGVFSKTGCCSDDEELRRYGCWSPEYKTLDLPSYRTLFIFLATVPLEVVHEYLLMRLEQKPTNPSALSIRQLMRELKTGLYKAIQEREICHNFP
ncbi:unnamed protein product [Phyllotreta striolata]|uniref:Mitogen-activated protein kinase kinase kinase N-terminal domain-containing protein n=1 Tax=Phyllotreta striolata TaxID=444603 RepID=A0A9N9TJH9_PHYSR|nr:unnamed protein product [Phyllotreta striolata]